MSKTLPDGIRLAQLDDENFPLFHRLFNTVFKQKHPVDWLLRKYNTSYLGITQRYLGYLAINEAGEAVSYCGHIPFQFEVKGQQFLGAHSCDHMTLEAYRGQGLFQLLNTKAEALVLAADISLIFGFPNQNNHPILVKHAGWEIIDTMQAFVFSVNTLPLAGILSKRSWLNRFYQLWCKRCMAFYQTHHQPISSVKGAGLLRDEAFFSYKRAFRKSEVLAFENGRVWLHLSSQLAIGDLELRSTGTLDGLIEELKKLAQKLMISRITFLCSSYHPLVSGLSAIIPPVMGNGVGLKYLNKDQVGKLPPLLFAYGDYDTF